MTKVTFVHVDGRREQFEDNDGQTVMQLALNNAVDGIIGECGGNLSCASCHVFVEEKWAAMLPEPTAEESSMLEATAVEPTEFSRLCCQINCSPELDGIVVHIPLHNR